MNETLQQLYERKSTCTFDDRELTPEQIHTILEASTMAPTAGNQQLYTILHVTDMQASTNKFS